MALADDLQTDIAAVLDDADFGRQVTLRRKTPASYDPSTGSAGSATTTDYTTRGIVLAYRDRAIDGALVRRGDRKCILKVKNLATAPQVGDQLIVGSDTYTVIDFKTGELGGTAFVYTLQIRSGGGDQG